MNIRIKGYLTFRDVIGDITVLESEAGVYRLRHLLERLSSDHEDTLGYKIFDEKNA